jgi:hypothetical protein
MNLVVLFAPPKVHLSILVTLVNKDFVKCLILPDSYVFFGAESEYDLRICPGGFIFL